MEWSALGLRLGVSARVLSRADRRLPARKGVAVRLFLSVFLTLYLGIMAGVLCAILWVAFDETRKAWRECLRRRRLSRLVAILFAVALVGCAQSPPRVVSLPPSCPAPRTPPDTPDLPPSLPALTIGATDDPAQAILQNRIASQQAYATCLQALKTLSEFLHTAPVKP